MLCSAREGLKKKNNNREKQKILFNKTFPKIQFAIEIV